MTNKNKKILFFIGTLRSGGKERRLVELLTYLKANSRYSMMVVLNSEDIYYESFIKLNVPFRVLKKRQKFKDPFLFFRFFLICKKFKPNIIHTWGSMQTFYAIPTSILLRIPIINSQITSAPPKIKQWSFSNFVNQINFFFSKVVLSNSYAGLSAYNVKGNKFKVIHNGINLKRFSGLKPIEETKKLWGVKTPLTVIMLANISINKDFKKFVKVANRVLECRKDVSFVIAGRNTDQTLYNKIHDLAQNNPNILFTGRVDDVESLINASEIGVLFSPNGEGISNSIMEYMTLSKPVIANDAGGTRELVRNNKNGFLVTEETLEEIKNKILELLNDEAQRRNMGKNGRIIIEESFTLEKMGGSFMQLYENLH